MRKLTSIVILLYGMIQGSFAQNWEISGQVQSAQTTRRAGLLSIFIINKPYHTIRQWCSMWSERITTPT